MIPSILSSQLKRGLTDYIDTTFQITTPLFQNTIIDLLENKNKVFREPYVSVKLPFRKCEEDKKWFEGIDLKFPPYLHQEKSFERLNYNSPKSTLVATGTGSGKTECFLYPILEYCYKHRGEDGIKAILIYPMNALATDQAKRLAELINTNDNLRGSIKAGMFVGDKEEHPSKNMMRKQIITDRDVLRDNPPDILLTNYKMLDYLLLRPNDAKLWNKNNPATLKFIVVDELHTFDGAQGTDLAVLIRRLKARLFTPSNYLCCVGTSATMGSKQHGQALREYASNIFGENFDETSIITEDRLSSSEFFEDIDIDYMDIPNKDSFEKLSEIVNGKFDEIEYIKESVRLWFNKDYNREYIQTKEFRVNLSDELRHCKFFRDIVDIINSKSVEYSYIFERLSRTYTVLNDNEESYEYFINLLESILALTSYARLDGGKDKMVFFLQVHIQIWLKELRRLMAKVDKNVKLELYDSLDDNSNEKSRSYLPPINCRDCGATGWVTRNNEEGNLVIPDLREFYSSYFSNDSDIKMLFPIDSNNKNFKDEDKYKVCPKCMTIRYPSNVDKCFNCNNTDLIDVYIPSIDDLIKRKDSNGCPCCGSSSGLALIGARSATLISAGISEVFASKFNDDKKILTFSDSVQDASHRAGFFNSRTWRFTLREAIQKFVLDSGKDMSLKEFANKFNEYWIDKLGIEGYVSTFIPPDMTWRKAYEDMTEQGSLNLEREASKYLLKNIKERIELEIYYEYGFNSRIGRTLEKSGASIIELDYSHIDKVLDRIYTKLINECENLSELNIQHLQSIIIGILMKLKINGGIYKDSLQSYINYEYMLPKIYKNWMASTSSIKSPSYLALYSSSKPNGVFTVLDNKSWYYKWMRKNLTDIHPLVRQDTPNEVYKIILNELVNGGVLLRINTSKNNTVYAINDELYKINIEVEQVICDKCGHSISLPKSQHEYAKGMYCFRNECSGKYEKTKEGLDFYGKLYSNGDLCRVYSKEHTGLLDRDTREKVEKDFKKSKQEQKPWDTNVLSCTPTLEMGIDIGDLSTVVLCSVPPGQAQYQQRVGRAGRRDGNAMTIVVANSKEHDLYFYEEPQEMISTVVDPPSIFLDASAVLQRQFIAYCFDTWVKTGATVKDIPQDLKKALANINKPEKKIFPYNFIEYIDNNLSWIFTGFIEMFREKLSDESKDQLNKFVYGDKENEGSLKYKIINTFTTTEKERKSIKEDINKLKKAIDKLDEKPKDKSYDEDKEVLTQEKVALQNIVKELENKNIFNYLSDEGLLPNYAFPESGVTLKSVIYRKVNEENDDESYIKEKKIYTSYEYQRAAASAIHELAPENNFYVDGRKVTIDRVDVKMAEPEYWRLCPSCAHAEIDVEGKNVSQCPHCGDLTWADSGQRKQMLKLKMVYSLQEYSKSKSGDESEDREQKYFNRQMLVDVDSNKDITDAYMVDGENQPFGFEFIQKATLREVNFGEIDGPGEQVSVAGKKNIRTGFKVCKYCGKVQKKNQKEPIHSRTCKARSYKKNTIEDCLYLYRQFESEAIRILVPAINLEISNQKLQSFIASVMLGLKKHFGSVEHLKICISEEPVENSALRKNYIVIYDTVPGGTGYLKQLMKSKEPIMDILQKALDTINACDCKDGCYRCLYAYKQSNQINQISRSEARYMLSDILKYRDKLVKIKTIDDILINSLFDSELEKKFIEALGRIGNIEKQMIDMDLGYRFEINDNVWHIKQQVNLGYEDNVVINCRPDFIIYPSKSNLEYIKPIAVFTDGYTYHKDSIGIDLAKRMAVAKSKNYHVWTLSWKDIDSVFRNEYGYYTNYISPSELNIQGRYNQFINGYKINDRKLHSKNSFDLLMHLLSNPKDTLLIKQLIFIYIASLNIHQSMQQKQEFKNFVNKLKSIVDEEWSYNNLLDLDNPNLQEFFNIKEFEEANVCLYTGILKEDFIKSKIENSLIVSILSDKKENMDENFEKHWNGFMRMYNFFQFSTNSLFISLTGLEQGVYNKIFGIEEKEQSSMVNKFNMDEELEELKDLCDESCYILLDQLCEREILYPDECGYELVDYNGQVIAECELAWSESKIAIILDDYEEHRSTFEQNGWKVFSINDYDIETLIESLNLQASNN